MMKRTLLVALAFLPGFGSAQRVTDGCVVCHKDALSLKGKETAAIAARLRDMRDGRAQHPTPLPRLADDELETVARELTAE